MRIGRSLLSLVSVLIVGTQASYGDVLCKAKKSGAVTARPTVCTKKETAIGSIANTTTSTSASADITIGTDLTVQDSGAVSSGLDTTVGLDLSVNRLNARGGSINTTGLNVAVIGDSGGDSTNVGLSVQASGADTNYCALFQGGNVGIGVSDPDEALEIGGRLHLGQSSTPSDVSDKLYNVGGTLFWGGQTVGVGSSSGSGGITAVIAGAGLAGGGSSGAVTLSVNAGTSAGNIVQLNASGELPAVSGVNLTAVNATSLSSGTVPDGRLSGNVSLLGSSIGLSSEVSGTLPVTNGGTGASTLTDLIALGTHTVGDYVATALAGTGILVSGGTGEGSATTVSVDQAFSPSWSGTHSFQGLVNVGTTTASVEALHLNGRLHMEPSSVPSTTTNKLYNVGGALFFNGLNISTNAAGGDITEVAAGSGLIGGGTSGSVTLSVDTGTTAGDIVQLNGSAQLPALSGINLTNLSATNIASGSLADARLSNNVSLLGSSIGLTTEVAGILPAGNGGTGANSLVDLIALGTHTTGSYVAAVAAGAGIALNSTAAEGGTATLSVNQSFAPTWTNTHTFSGVASDLTTATNEDFAIMPSGTGKVGIGTTSPSAMLDTVFTSTNTIAGSEIGNEFNITDTGVVSSGTDTLRGLDLNVDRSGATGGAIDTIGLDVNVAADGGGAATTTATGLLVNASGADTNYSAIFTGGNVGIGVTAPTSRLHTLSSSTSTSAASEIGHSLVTNDTGVVTTGTDSTTGLNVQLSRTGATGGTIDARALSVTATGDSAGAGTSTTTGLAVAVSGGDSTIAATFTGGSVGIGTTTAVLTDTDVVSGSMVIGDGALCVDNSNNDCATGVRAAGTIYAETTVVSGIDVAEEFPIRNGDTVQAGDIVIADTSVAEKCLERGAPSDPAGTCKRSEMGLVPFVTRSRGNVAENKRVLGVVSTQPGMTLGGFAREELVAYHKVPVALAGRVPVKVSGQNGPIELGDRVTPSSTPGVGMRANEGDLVVGIALEPFDGNGESRVLVLVK